MKKLFVAIAALVMSLSASAFSFDGIDLNGSVADITRQVSSKGYCFDDTRNCLVGVCQGTEIYLSFNYVDVTKQGKLGQLIVDVPMAEADALAVISKTFNVVYHQIAKTENSYSYGVSEDGTVLVVNKTANGIRLTYNTPYYKVKK